MVFWSGLALVETTGTWPQGLLDAYIDMIPKADGDSTPSVNGPSACSQLCTGCGPPFGLDIFGSGLKGWLPQSVFSLGNGLSSVEAWFSTALDIEEVLQLTGPFWIALWGGFEGLIFLIIIRFVSGFSLRLVLENPGVGMVVFLKVVLLVWCSLWPCMSLGAVILRFCLMSSRHFMLIIAKRPGALFESARFTARYVRSVGQDVSSGQCVLLSTSKSVRKALKLWDISGDGSFWKVQLDVRDLGGHLDFTGRARAGTLSKRVGEATVGVAAVGALHSGTSG